MSMGVWNENAETDDLDLIRQAVKRAKEAKTDTLAELRAIADKKHESGELSEVVRSINGRKGDNQYTSVKVDAKFPYSAIDAQGRTIRYRVAEVTFGGTILGFPVITGAKLELKPQSVRNFSNLRDNYIQVEGHVRFAGGYFAETDPEWIVTTFWDNMEELYEIL